METIRDKSKALSVVFASASDIGLKRTENQDCHGKFPPDDLSLTTSKGQLFIVADGLGGHLGGREASTMAVDIIQQRYFSDEDEDVARSLCRAVEVANARIYERSSQFANFHGMGTTCTALVLKDDLAYIAHVGDSRAYRITPSQIEQLTQDHSTVAEMQRLGFLTAEEARHHPEKSQLYRALGVSPLVQIDLIENIPLKSDEYFLLCTDGMAKIEDWEIQEIVLSNSPQQACHKLIELANERGGSDNVTMQVIRIQTAEARSEKMRGIIRKWWRRF